MFALFSWFKLFVFDPSEITFVVVKGFNLLSYTCAHF